MRFTPHSEFRYYVFGLRAGVSNLLANGLTLGLRKTVGKITQPIHGPSRFPEYFWFESAIRAHQHKSAPERRLRILDVGSPKMMGLFLAFNTDADVTLTDISQVDIREYGRVWNGLLARAHGRAEFSQQDARSLAYPDDTFDIVYSMSVLEHVAGEKGDCLAVRELLRVLKPGGLLVLSVPYGALYTEQERIGFSGAARRTGDRQAYFFQRVYDREQVQRRILDSAATLEQVALITVLRRHHWLLRAFAAIGENGRGALGFLNPLLSIVINRSLPGLCDAGNTRYARLHSAGDSYGDLIVTGRKPTASQCANSPVT